MSRSSSLLSNVTYKHSVYESCVSLQSCHQDDLGIVSGTATVDTVPSETRLRPRQAFSKTVKRTRLRWWRPLAKIPTDITRSKQALVKTVLNGTRIGSRYAFNNAILSFRYDLL